MAELTHEGYFDQSVSLLVLEQKKRISVIQKIGGKKRCDRYRNSRVQ